MDIERKITTKGHVYGLVGGTNIFFLRWVITQQQIAIVKELQSPQLTLINNG
jgi:hypothetical protein